jgi:hypothetical protein
MELGPSLLLIAIGAVLRFAVTATVSGVNLRTIGLIVLIVGIIGLILSIMWMFSRRSRVGVVEEQPVAAAPAYREARYR